jgi:hypothetical protein
MIREALTRAQQNPLAVPGSVLEAWHGCGLAAVTVREDELGTFRDALGAVVSVLRQRLGTTGTTVLASAELPGGGVIRLDNGPLVLPAGKLELGLSCHVAPDWLAAAGGVRSAMVFEITARFRESAMRVPGSVGGTEETEFERLRLEGVVRKGEVLVVLPEWFASESRLAGDHGEETRIGPEVPQPGSLGETLLGGSGGRRRTLVVVRALIPDRFILMP